MSLSSAKTSGGKGAEPAGDRRPSAVTAQVPKLERISAERGGSVWGVDSQGVLWGSTEGRVPWVPEPAGPGSAGFVSLSAAADSTVYAVDTHGAYYMYQDTWSRLGELPDGTLAFVSVGAADAVYGVDATGRLLRFEPQAKLWQTIAGPADGTVVECAATGDGELFCLTSTGNAYRYNASSSRSEDGRSARRGAPDASWSALAAPAPLAHLDAAEGGWIWGITTAGGLVQYSSQGWESVPGPGGAPVTRVAVGADLTVWTLDASGRLFQFDAAHTAWLPITLVVALTEITVGAIDSAWALGVGHKVLRYTESTAIWSPAGAPGTYKELAAVDDDRLWLVDRNRQVVELTAARGRWTVTPKAAGPIQIAAGHDGSLWGPDASGSVLGYEPGTAAWHPLPALAAPAIRVSAGDAASVTALDAAGGVNCYDSGHGRWFALDEGAPADGFVDISTLPGGAVFAAARDGHLYVYLGTWVRSAATATAVAAIGPYDLWILDADGYPRHELRGSGEGTQSAAPDLPGWDAEDVFDETRSTHLWIVNRAIRRAGKAGGPIAQWLVKVLHPGEGRINDPLHDNLCQGLYDADFVAPYNNPSFGVPTFSSHFYDPTTGRNWLGQTSPTALTQGTQYFRESVAKYLTGQLDSPEGAGYRLGLALHYMTDLTQPMHAGNFTYLDSKRNGYHPDYEAYILGYQADARLQPTFYPIPELGGDPAAYLTAAARHSRPYLPSITPETITQNYSFFSAQCGEIARQSASDLLGYAIAATAGFLLAWADQTYRRPKDWEDLGQPAPGVTAVQGVAATFVTGRPYVWVTGSDGNLWLRWYTGGHAWAWDNRGGPGTAIGAGIGADTSSVGPAAYMFDEAGNVVVQWWDESEGWYWTDLGAPSQSTDTEGDESRGTGEITAGAVAALPQDTAVFVLTDRGELFKNQVPLFTWQQIQPPFSGGVLAHLYGATNADGTRCVLADTADGQLWVWRESSGAAGSWVQVDPPHGGATITAGYGVAPYVACFLCSTGDVQVCQWDVGGGGNWMVIGRPRDDLSVISGLTVNIQQSPYYDPFVMSRTDGGPLVIGGFGGWDVRGEPGTTKIVSVAGFLPYQGDFLTAVVGADGHLWA